MTTRYFKVIHRAGAFIDGVHYPCADDQNDITSSIVPLDDSVEGFKEPQWGVEVDVNGNEIGERPDPYSAQDTIGNKLADNISGKAGIGPNAQKAGHAGVDTPNRNQDENRKDGSNPNGLAKGTKKEAEERKATIVQTLELLDHDKDDDWTADGKPKVDVVANASGLEGLTRAEIEEAQPDFKRTKAE